MPRTIVISDLHGMVQPLERVLAHAQASSEDEIVIAGDLVDIGTDDTIGRASDIGALVLAGNHEVAAALGLVISPQNKESLDLGPEFAERITWGDWRLAHACDGWLVTHAGVSSAFLASTGLLGQDAETLADSLNALFVEEMTRAVRSVPMDWWDLEEYAILGGHGGPLWFRPLRTAKLPAGIRQIVGHTPPETFEDYELEALERAGWLLIDPGIGHGRTGSRRGMAHLIDPSFRYAVIEAGDARVIEG